MIKKNPKGFFLFALLEAVLLALCTADRVTLLFALLLLWSFLSENSYVATLCYVPCSSCTPQADTGTSHRLTHKKKTYFAISRWKINRKKGKEILILDFAVFGQAIHFAALAFILTSHLAGLRFASPFAKSATR